MTSSRAGPFVAETLAAGIVRLGAEPVPEAMREKCRNLLIDVLGLCLAARQEDYVKAALAAWDENGPCTAIGHARPLSAAGAAFVNGTAAHGEDFDDTFEGGPVHAGAVVVPAVIAACERYGGTGADVLRGVAIGAEVLCRASLVVPKEIHRAGFHPTAVLGTIAATAAVGTVLRVPANALVNAFGVAGSMASGIIEYLAEGTWTKRLHPGWAAQSGLRAALLGQAGFAGPRTVFEGDHGFFHGFARTRRGDFAVLSDGFGDRWIAETLAFKPYPCGTMIHPYIDCAKRLAARGLSSGDIEALVCPSAEAIVHRLWEPLTEKQEPANGYAAKFSMPYCIAYAFLHRRLGLDSFSEPAVSDASVRALAKKVRYEIDPESPYPKQFTGHIRAHLRDGQVVEEHQPHFRGGANDPLTREEIEQKFKLNAAYGGWPDAEGALDAARRILDRDFDVASFRR